MVRSLSAIAILIFVATWYFAIPNNVGADLNYSFSLEKELVEVHIKKDGSIDIDYIFEFINYGQLDGVDVGLPNRYYDANSARAQILVDGNIYSPAKIHKSPYVAIGLAVEFDSITRSKIEKYGTHFTLKFHVNNPHMIYLNELKEGTVGIKFRPTWFNPDYQRGTTGILQSRIYFPEGFTNQSSAIYLSNHKWDYLGIDNSTGLLFADWTRKNVNPKDQENGMYDIGVGFPKEYVNTYYKHDFWEALNDFFYSAGVFLITFSPCIGIATIVSVIFILGYRESRKRAKDYFEPKLSVAGAGPRRDLTAVEAAVALEKPLEIVATMILFGLIKKGKVSIVSNETPMRLNKTAARAWDYPYETEYINAINYDGTINRELLKKALINLIEATRTKLQGFDYNATKEYYKSICEKAWEQVKTAGTPEEFAKGLNLNNEWMMLDDSYSKRMETVYVGVPDTYHEGSYHPVQGSRSGYNLQQIAQNYVSSVKSASSNLVTNIKSLSQEVTSVTNPVPVSSGDYGGGGGCACACACACAGGGR